MTDDELCQAYNQPDRSFGKFYFFPVFARNPEKFREIIFEQSVNPTNSNYVFGGIKNAWLIVVSIMEHCKDKAFIHELIDHVKTHWEIDDYQEFKNYISTNDNFVSFFDKEKE